MVRKFNIFILFSILVLLTLNPAYSTNWYEYSKDIFIDLDSISKSDNPFNDNIYLMWIKAINYPSKEYPKVNFVMQKNLIDCNLKKIAVESLMLYDGAGNIIDNITIKYKWNSIPPNTHAHFYYNLICQKGSDNNGK